MEIDLYRKVAMNLYMDNLKSTLKNLTNEDLIVIQATFEVGFGVGSVYFIGDKTREEMLKTLLK